MIGIILAAGRGSRLKEHTEEHPKCLTKLHGKALLDWQLDTLRQSSLEDIIVVTGYLGHMITARSIEALTNDKWATTNMVSSLCMASEIISKSGAIISYSDIIYPLEAIEALLVSDADIAITYDVNWLDLWSLRFEDPLDDAESFKISPENQIVEIGLKAKSTQDIQGQYMGLLKFTPAGWQQVINYLSEYSHEQVAKLDMTSLLQRLIQNGVKIQGIPFKGKWYEVDTPEDLEIYTNIEKLF